MSKCMVHGCDELGDRVSLIAFHKIPKDKTRSKLWLKRLGRQDLIDLPQEKLNRFLVCDRHFPESAFTSTLRGRLNKFAEPLPLWFAHNNGSDMMAVDPASVEAATIFSYSEEEDGNNSSGETYGGRDDTSQHVLVGDPNMTEDDLARFAVSTLYSSSEGEGEQEGNESSNDCEVMEVKTEVNFAPPRTFESAPRPPSLLTRSKASQASGRPSQPSPAKTKERREQQPSTGGCNHGPYIKKLEKCLVDRSIEIQGLKVKNLSLKRKNEELTKALAKLQKSRCKSY